MTRHPGLRSINVGDFAFKSPIDSHTRTDGQLPLLACIVLSMVSASIAIGTFSVFRGRRRALALCVGLAGLSIGIGCLEKRPRNPEYPRMEAIMAAVGTLDFDHTCVANGATKERATPDQQRFPCHHAGKYRAVGWGPQDMHVVRYTDNGHFALVIQVGKGAYLAKDVDLDEVVRAFGLPL